MARESWSGERAYVPAVVDITLEEAVRNALTQPMTGASFPVQNASADAQTVSSGIGIQQVRRGLLVMLGPDTSITVSSDSWADVDKANLSRTMMCSGRPVFCFLTGRFSRNTASWVSFTIAIDGKDIVEPATYTGLIHMNNVTWAWHDVPTLVGFGVASPPPGPHTFSVQGMVAMGGGSATIVSGRAGDLPGDLRGVVDAADDMGHPEARRAAACHPAERVAAREPGDLGRGVAS